jgi:hypothetical protein
VNRPSRVPPGSQRIPSSSYEEAVARREATEGLGRRKRRQELPDVQRSEDLLRMQLREDIVKLERMEPLGAVARREREIADQVLAKRTEQALIAARLSPPPYIVKELGERPTDPAKAKTWDIGVKEIESYRLEHGVEDRTSALGREPQGASRSAAREAAQRRLVETRRRLGLERQLAQSRGRGIEHGGGFGISM